MPQELIAVSVLVCLLIVREVCTAKRNVTLSFNPMRSFIHSCESNNPTSPPRSTLARPQQAGNLAAMVKIMALTVLVKKGNSEILLPPMSACVLWTKCLPPEPRGAQLRPLAGHHASWPGWHNRRAVI